MFSSTRLSALVVAVVAAGLASAQNSTSGSSGPSCVYASWSNNGDNQNPCEVWAALGSKCGGSFTVQSLAPASTATNGTSGGYPVPSSSGVVPINDCQCNMIAYSLMAACSWCQDGVYSDSWPTISAWQQGCGSKFVDNGIANSVNTTGINVPPFATQKVGTPWWDPTNAQAAQVALGSSGTTNGTTSTPHSGGVVSRKAAGTAASLVALAPLYLLL